MQMLETANSIDLTPASASVASSALGEPLPELPPARPSTVYNLILTLQGCKASLTSAAPIPAAAYTLPYALELAFA